MTRMSALLILMGSIAVASSCALPPAAESGGDTMVVKTSAATRAARRLFDGAPPVIPHRPMGATCVSCHNERGIAVAGLGFAPPSPHEATLGMSRIARCAQCHVYTGGKAPFIRSTFVGLPQDMRRGARLNAKAPPVMPHAVFMRENCLACHSGPAAREDIRTDHPERIRCRQCHVEVVDTGRFGNTAGAAVPGASVP